MAHLLSGRLKEDGIPAGWSESIQADLEARLPRPACPPVSGDPSWDRLRVRWGGDLPDTAAGYPPWACRAHPCADPFHWMAEGLRAYMAPDMEGALWAFRFAHAHFRRLGSAFWVEFCSTGTASGFIRPILPHWA